VNPTLTTFLFEMANFLVLAGVLGWLFFKPVRQALSDYRQKLEADNQLAAQKLAEVEKVQQEMNAQRAQLQSELTEQRARQLAEARQRADRIVGDARSAAERELELSQRQIARFMENQQEALAEVSAAAAADIVGRLLEQIDGPELQSALIESACRQLATMSPQELAPVKIESAEPLSTAQSNRVREALGPSAADAEFRRVDHIGAGIRITTRKGLIDASVSGLTQFARHALVKAMNQPKSNHTMQSVDDDGK
jgi:F-type H+-transporting ATPase subunit b